MLISFARSETTVEERLWKLNSLYARGNLSVYICWIWAELRVGLRCITSSCLEIHRERL